MKRSEAEKIINDWLDNSLEITGKTILDLLESRINMRPPTKINTVSLRDVPDDIFRVWSYDQRVQQWDPE